MTLKYDRREAMGGLVGLAGAVLFGGEARGQEPQLGPSPNPAQVPGYVQVAEMARPTDLILYIERCQEAKKKAKADQMTSMERELAARNVSITSTVPMKLSKMGGTQRLHFLVDYHYSRHDESGKECFEETLTVQERGDSGSTVHQYVLQGNLCLPKDVPSSERSMMATYTLMSEKSEKSDFTLDNKVVQPVDQMGVHYLILLNEEARKLLERQDNSGGTK